MNIEDLISQYIDGTLSGDAEAELHHRLAVSPEARRLFRAHIMLRGMARDQRVLHAPTPAMRSSLFDRLQREEGLGDVSVMPADDQIAGLSATALSAAALPIHGDVPPVASVHVSEPGRRRRRILPWLVPLVIACAALLVLWNPTARYSGNGGGDLAVNEGPRAAAPGAGVEGSVAGSATAPVAGGSKQAAPSAVGSSTSHDAQLGSALPQSEPAAVVDQRAVPNESIRPARVAYRRARAVGNRDVAVLSRSESADEYARDRAPEAVMAPVSPTLNGDMDASKAEPELKSSLAYKSTLGKAATDSEGSIALTSTESNKSSDVLANAESNTARDTRPHDADGAYADDIAAAKPDDVSSARLSMTKLDSASGSALGMEGRANEPVSLSDADSSVASRTLALAQDNTASSNDDRTEVPRSRHYASKKLTEPASKKPTLAMTQPDDARRSQPKGEAQQAGGGSYAALENGRGASSNPAPPPPPPPPLMSGPSLTSQPDASEVSNTVRSDRTLASSSGVSADDKPTSLTRDGLASNMADNTAIDAPASQEQAEAEHPAKLREKVVLGSPVLTESAPATTMMGGASHEQRVLAVPDESTTALSPQSSRDLVWFIGVQQNTLVNVTVSDIGLQGVLRVGLELGDEARHQLFFQIGAASYREDVADSLMATMTGGVVTPAAQVVVDRSLNARTEPWAGVGYRYQVITMGAFDIGLGAVAGVGTRHFRFSADAPIGLRISKAFRIEIIPMVQFARALGSAEQLSITDFDPSRTTSERRQQRTTSRGNEEAVPGLGLGVAMRW